MAQMILQLASVFMNHCTKEFGADFQCPVIVKPVPGKKYKDKLKNILSQPVPNYVRHHQQCDLHVTAQPNARALEHSQWFTKCFIKTGFTGSAEKQSKQRLTMAWVS